MDSPYNRQEPWADFARRFEERMARRAERWQARAERRAARGHGCGAARGGADWSDPSPRESEERNLRDKVEAMAKTIQALGERVGVLEKLAADPEAALRAEIEKLRREDGVGGRGA